MPEMNQGFDENEQKMNDALEESRAARIRAEVMELAKQHGMTHAMMPTGETQEMEDGSVGVVLGETVGVDEQLEKSKKEHKEKFEEARAAGAAMAGEDRLAYIATQNAKAIAGQNAPIRKLRGEEEDRYAGMDKSLNSVNRAAKNRTKMDVIKEKKQRLGDYDEETGSA